MRVVSVGDLVADFYYKNGKIVGINGGMTSHNIVANISKMGVKTSVFGVCGNDQAGSITINSLKDLGVNVDNIEIYNNISTRSFHISYFEKNQNLEFTSKKRCPICNEKNWYDDSKIDEIKVLSNIEDNDILIFDNLNFKNQIIIDKCSNKKMLDLGQYFELENYNNEEIINKIYKKFELVNLNERVEKYLIKRFSLKSTLDLYNLFSPKMLIITRGKKGTDFVYDNNLITKSLLKPSEEIDPTGAGDAFFSVIIVEYIKNNYIINEKIIDLSFKKATKLTNKVVKKFGARGHLKSLYKIKPKSNCICKDFEIVFRKKVKACNININNLEARVLNALNSDALRKLNNVDFSKSGSYIFAGTGGSFAAATFASIIINQIYGSNVYAMYPRDILYRNNSSIDKVFLFSYSGTTSDLLESTKKFNKKNKYIITKGDVKKIKLKSDLTDENIISYKKSTNNGKERGFLSFEGAVAPTVIFLKYYFEKVNLDYDLNIFIRDTFNYWNTFFSNQFKNDNIKKLFKQKNLINIFKGDYTNCACIDIESKIIESGIFNCICHEKKNFSHGRFINYENLNNTNSLYFKQKTTNKYERKLLEYLRKGNNFIIESRYDGVLCEFDLLIASQLLIYYIGLLLDIDVSKPKYSDEAMKIYFYKDEL